VKSWHDSCANCQADFARILVILNHAQKSKMKHFAIAFFGYYLQGREEYFEYFSKQFVNQFDDLVWGVYP
jgi:hypothetical protein